jgi:hypothetical protein
MEYVSDLVTVKRQHEGMSRVGENYLLPSFFWKQAGGEVVTMKRQVWEGKI